jgi:sugar (pentulose or hexulose) kinase
MPKKTPVIAILDIGKTNKKAFLFDEDYNIVYEQTAQLEETIDEEGFPCEDVVRLRDWVKQSYRAMKDSDEFEIKALNVSAYGASFVHLDKEGEILTPLYNYLKPYPEELAKQFYRTYGGEHTLSLKTASPVLGSLNSGLQLYRLKKERPNLFTRVHKSLHLPQFITWLITGHVWSDITSIGCHTALWDFSEKKYHEWVVAEGVDRKFPSLVSSDSALPVKQGNHELIAGVGLHDSSAALVPYLAQFKEPFLLLSTGTWCISLNPFSKSPLTTEELSNDCLCYLDYKGNPVKASRLFGGNEHEQQTKRMAEHYHVGLDHYKEVDYNPGIVENLVASSGLTLSDKRGIPQREGGGSGVYQSLFRRRDLSLYKTYEEAYHQLVLDIMADQVIATRRVMDKGDRTQRIFVDGGFSNNAVFMNLLAASFADKQVFSASLHQASALGAALAIHSHWNRKAAPAHLIKLSEL